MHANLADIDKLTWEYTARSEVPRERQRAIFSQWHESEPSRTVNSNTDCAADRSVAAGRSSATRTTSSAQRHQWRQHDSCSREQRRKVTTPSCSISVECYGRSRRATSGAQYIRPQHGLEALQGCIRPRGDGGVRQILRGSRMRENRTSAGGSA